MNGLVDSIIGGLIVALIIALVTVLVRWKRPEIERLLLKIQRLLLNLYPRLLRVIRPLVPYICVVFVATFIAVVVWFFRLATLGQSIGFAIGAAIIICAWMWLLRRHGREGDTGTRGWVYWVVSVVIGVSSVIIGVIISIFSFIYFDPVIFEDDFSDESGGWSVGTFGVAGDARYDDGGYLLRASPPWVRTQALAADARNVRDVIVKVEATTTGDEPGEDGTTLWGKEYGTSNWGIVCRAQDDNGDSSLVKNSYFMGIYGKGYAQFRKWKDGKDEGPPHLDGTSKYRQLISDSNRRTHYIRAACVGNTLTLWINGKEVLEEVLEDDEAEFKSGKVGLFVFQHAGEEGSDTTEVLFDNFVVCHAVRPPIGFWWRDACEVRQEA